MDNSFSYGHASAPQWITAAQDCLAQLGGKPAGANLGFLYVTDDFADDLEDILDFFKARTAVAHWVGGVGVGICATGQEYLDEAAMAVMLAALPADAFRVLPGLTLSSPGLTAPDLAHVHGRPAQSGIVHGDPYTAGIPELIELLAGRVASGFLVGGLTSSRRRNLQIADTVGSGCLSGVLLADTVPIVSRLTQGVSPLGPQHEVTDCQRNILISLDGRPALDVFYEEIGEILARDLNRAAGYIFAGLPIPGSDTGDYLVRNLIGIDTGQKLIAIGEMLEPGMPLMFCRRDGMSAHQDMLRMLAELKRELRAPPRGGVYYSCLGRGAGLFGPDSVELKLIREQLGDFPLVGFFANGEISHDRLYGYTGVLTLFT
ncbi:FIST C-terminal domain-containing protein [Thermithiobacillus tepidarius DSM 3134]|uniref:FIST signal transduction protein n=1 Tax=Thermithiobacillus tepidarius TaxID=929 RepID=UPI00048D1F42|nr:FIST N-terminal domain-containing protein [Thermithiobacillus tepidarius]